MRRRRHVSRHRDSRRSNSSSSRPAIGRSCRVTSHWNALAAHGGSWLVNLERASRRASMCLGSTCQLSLLFSETLRRRVFDASRSCQLYIAWRRRRFHSILLFLFWNKSLNDANEDCFPFFVVLLSKFFVCSSRPGHCHDGHRGRTLTLFSWSEISVIYSVTFFFLGRRIFYRVERRVNLVTFLFIFFGS